MDNLDMDMGSVVVSLILFLGGCCTCCCSCTLTWVGLCHFKARFFEFLSALEGICWCGPVLVGGGTQDKGLGGTHRCVSRDVLAGDVVMDGGEEDDV